MLLTAQAPVFLTNDILILIIASRASCDCSLAFAANNRSILPAKLTPRAAEAAIKT